MSSRDGARFLPADHHGVDCHCAVLYRLLPDHGHHHSHDAVSDAVQEMRDSNSVGNRHCRLPHDQVSRTPMG